MNVEQKARNLALKIWLHCHAGSTFDQQRAAEEIKAALQDCEIAAERDELKAMVAKIAEGQDPVKVLTEGMAMVIERDKQIADLAKERDALKVEASKYEFALDTLTAENADLTRQLAEARAQP